jgi:ferredoxin
MGRHSPANRTYRLRVHPVACDGIDICLHIAPTLVRSDSWSYPLLAEGPLHGADRRVAEAATAACPRRALFVESTVDA